jgi:hypothetical protein
MNNPDNISESLETIFWVKILKFFDADPRWKNLDTGSGMEKIRIRDKQPRSTTLLYNANACLYLGCVAVRASASGAEERRRGRPRAQRS